MNPIKQTIDLAETLEGLNNFELFKFTQNLLVLKMKPETNEKTRELAVALIEVINDWISSTCKDQP